MRGLGGYGWGTEMRGARPGSEVVSKMCKRALGRREGDFNLHQDWYFPCNSSQAQAPISFPPLHHNPQILLSPPHITPHQSSNLGNSHHSCASSVAGRKRGNKKRQKFGPFLLLRQSSCHKTVLSGQQQCDMQAEGITSIINYTLFYLDLTRFPCKRDQKKGLQSKPSRYHSSSLRSKLPFPSTCLTSH